MNKTISPLDVSKKLDKLIQNNPDIMNCKVSTAENGHIALQLYADSMDSHDSFDLVILDLTVPGGGGGKETVGEILKIDPQAKVIVSSGYTDDPVMSRYEEFGFKAVITKPYVLK